MIKKTRESSSNKAFFALSVAVCSVLTAVYLFAKQSYFSNYASPFDIKTKARLHLHYGASIKEGAEFRVAGNAGFHGAQEWRDHWSSLPRYEGNVNDEYVPLAVESATEATLQHFNDMRQRYQNVSALPDFYARGIGWVQDRLGMILTVVVPGNANHNANATNLQPGPTSVFIVDIVGKMECDGNKENHPPLTMWVRANGPEIFAGTALPHAMRNSNRCAWLYSFDARSPGDYKIHVKVLTFNGFAKFNGTGDCNIEKLTPRNDSLFDSQKYLNDTAPDDEKKKDLAKLETMNAEFVREMAENGNFSHHRGLSGFKMYDAPDSCCSACTRARGCKMWTMPGASHFDECELYFDNIEDDLDFLDRDRSHYLGRDRNYSFIQQKPSDFPNVRRRLVVNASDIGKPWPIRVSPSKGSPRPGAATYFIGCGWSSMMTFENPCHYPSDDVVFGSGQNITVVTRTSPQEHAVKVSRLCNLQDERLDISNGRWVRYPFPDDSECSPFVEDKSPASFRGFRPLYRGDKPPRCWFRDDLTKIGTSCLETGCSHVLNHRWVTDLKRETKWMGAWESYDCSYEDMGDDLIQKCIDEKKISKIELKGASFKNMIEGYMKQKLQQINMTDPAVNGTHTVVFDTLKMPHLLWHLTVDDYQRDLEKMANVTSDVEYYWLSGFYVTSEREPHVHVDRSLQFSKVAMDILTPKGYKMINGFDVTAAFAFDTEGQADGLHILGPPLRAIITKFFHHLCHDVFSQ